MWLPTGLLLGGAAGNLIDRIRLGAVTDFIKFPHWPAFNVADICVTFGVISLIYVLEKESNDELPSRGGRGRAARRLPGRRTPARGRRRSG